MVIIPLNFVRCTLPSHRNRQVKSSLFNQGRSTGESNAIEVVFELGARGVNVSGDREGGQSHYEACGDVPKGKIHRMRYNSSDEIPSMTVLYQ